MAGRTLVVESITVEAAGSGHEQMRSSSAGSADECGTKTMDNRRVFFTDEWIDTPCYDRDALLPA